MTLIWDEGFWKLGLVNLLAMGGVIAYFGDYAIAQVTPDGTLGAESSVATPTNVNGQPGDVIDGGATRGANLFHSFEQFSIPTGGEAFFNNTLDIQNIISRVTGSSTSNIDGLLRANGTANLFLLNPNGIIFGRNARLSIGGSFVGSTASSLNFADGTQFSATAPQATPLLTVSVPIGLQYGGTAGGIQVQGNGEGLRRIDGSILDPTAGLHVRPDQTLAMVGGDISLEGGTLRTDGGRIELGSVAGAGRVNLTPTNNGWAMSYEGVPTFGDIQLSGAATVDASGSGGGDIQVQGRRARITSGSRIEASTLGTESGGTLAVVTSESVELTETLANDYLTGLASAVYPGATGSGGNLTVETQRLIIRDGAGISSGTLGQGSAGTLTISAHESVELSGTSSDFERPSFLTSDTGPPDLFAASLPFQVNATGQGGDLVIETQRLSVRDGAQVTTATSREGNAGKLQVDATESVEVIGTSANGQLFSRLSAAVGQEATGQGGDLRITTGQLNVGDRAFVTVSSQGLGDAGNLEVAANSIRLDNQGKLTAETASVQGGNITLQSRDLVLRRGSNITTNTTGTATGGNISIDTGVIAGLENSDITANAFGGQGGIIDISAQGVFGLVQRDLEEIRTLLRTDNPNELDPARLLTSDITAISQTDPSLRGQVTINNPDVDPSQGIIELPAEVVDASNSIAQGCPANGENKFIITGRGGLPPNPNDSLTGDNVLTEWNTLDSDVENLSSAEEGATDSTIESTNTQIVEANGWMTNDLGEVVLIATAPTATLNIPWLPKSNCNAPEPKS